MYHELFSKLVASVEQRTVSNEIPTIVQIIIVPISAF